MDNIGGCLDIKVIDRTKITGMQLNETAGSVTIAFANSAVFVNLPFQAGKSSISSTPDWPDAGLIYSHEAEIIIPRQYYTSQLRAELSDFLLYGGILCYTTNNFETFILGDDEYYLLATVEQLHPGDNAGFSGYRLHLSGKSLHPALFFEQS